MSEIDKQFDVTFKYASSDDEEAADNLLRIFKVIFFYGDNTQPSIEDFNHPNDLHD